MSKSRSTEGMVCLGLIFSACRGHAVSWIPVKQGVILRLFLESKSERCGMSSGRVGKCVIDRAVCLRGGKSGMAVRGGGSSGGVEVLWW